MRLYNTAFLLCFLPMAALAQAGPGMHFVESWDLDGDGAVTLAEVTERRGDVFYTFDADENGVLDATEYATFDEARAADMADNAKGHTKAATPIQQGMTRAFNDLDGDGNVSREEFMQRASDWFKVIDRNADHKITRDDFGPSNT